jgi:hypothetical protein
VSEQRGHVVAGLRAESAPDEDGAGQARAEDSQDDIQERDEAEREHGSELQRVADESEFP